ncbi:MAG: TrmJ/YjtD family RNA methyltransferase [Gemmatimonadetes bacterium]|nr:TrmJ/YjtD family RNA methyltransferase [Gemmatimonadota bacterium]
MTAASPPTIVLVEPQDLVNIAATFRIAKNFGVEYVRLVKPAVFDPYRIEGIAHNTGDLVNRCRIFSTLAEAVADCTYTVALTARERAAKRGLVRPREAAATLGDRSSEGPVALVFGREDKGLSNEELDQCHALVTIATNPAHRSLNLAQAVAIMAYECWNDREGLDQPRKPPRRRADGAAKAGEMERLFHDWERALCAVDFFKSRSAENVIRSLREAWFRADLDSREAKLLRAVALETVHYLERHGVLGELPERLRRPGGASSPEP